MSLLEDEKKAEERAKVIANEGAKLSATFLNGVAIALIAVGGLAPSFTASPVPLTESAAFLGAVSKAVCLIGALTLHLTARLFLRGLR